MSCITPENLIATPVIMLLIYTKSSVNPMALPIIYMVAQSKNPREGIFALCAGQDLNLRSPKASDLQSDVIDHSTTDACLP